MASNLHLDVTINVENAEDDLRKIIPQLRPEWNDRDVLFKETPREIQAGLLNLMIVAFVSPDNKDDAIMFRIRRDEKLPVDGLLNRDNEMKNIRLMRDTYNFSFVPRILASYQNGFCYDYIQGMVMTPETIRLDPNWRIIAKQLALIHSTPLDEKLKLGKSKFFEFIDKMVYPDKLADPKDNEKFEKYLPKKDYVTKECKEVMDHVSKLNCQNVFCHSDSRPENMVWNQQTGEITFVDWECAGMNSQAFEIAYHFRCFKGYEKSNNSAAYPDKEFQWQWLRVYLETYYGVVGPDHVVTDDDVHKLYVQVYCNYLAFLVQSVFWISTIEEMKFTQFDIVDHCIGNYNEYRRIKDEILSLQIPQ